LRAEAIQVTPEVPGLLAFGRRVENHTGAHKGIVRGIRVAGKVWDGASAGEG
jgi:hypothetical protein